MFKFSEALRQNHQPAELVSQVKDDKQNKEKVFCFK